MMPVPKDLVDAERMQKVFMESEPYALTSSEPIAKDCELKLVDNEKTRNVRCYLNIKKAQSILNRNGDRTDLFLTDKQKTQNEKAGKDYSTADRCEVSRDIFREYYRSIVTQKQWSQNNGLGPKNIRFVKKNMLSALNALEARQLCCLVKPDTKIVKDFKKMIDRKVLRLIDESIIAKVMQRLSLLDYIERVNKKNPAKGPRSEEHTSEPVTQ